MRILGASDGDGACGRRLRRRSAMEVSESEKTTERANVVCGRSGRGRSFGEKPQAGGGRGVLAGVYCAMSNE